MPLLSKLYKITRAYRKCVLGTKRRESVDSDSHNNDVVTQSFHTTTLTSTESSHGFVDEVTHNLAVNAAQSAEESLLKSLPQSLFAECEPDQKPDCIAPFRRQEIVLGDLLGSGQFGHVYEIRAFRLQSNDVHGNLFSTEEKERRLHMKEIGMYRQTGNARYALKHLKGNYLKRHSPYEYIQAAW